MHLTTPRALETHRYCIRRRLRMLACLSRANLHWPRRRQPL